MKAQISNQIKKFLYSSACPDLLFEWYFKRKLGKDHLRLEQLLQKGNGLMTQLKKGQQEHWKERIEDVMECPDNHDIPRVTNAGKILNNRLIMHNGIEINPLSYYHLPMLEMLRLNKGVHEPQEEKIFQNVLQTLDPSKRLTMLELGAYWSFYSIWFKKKYPNASCYMVEPNRKNLHYGKENFRINKIKGTFLQGKIGAQFDRKNQVLTVDHISNQQKINFIDLLHSDIQGFEGEMLEGARRMLSEQKVGYIFISTHSNQIHYQCKKVLEDFSYQIIANIDLDASYSWDGILVAKLPGYPGIDHVSYSKKMSVT